MNIRAIAAVCRLTMLENARKHIFHVLVLLTLTVIAASTLLSFFSLGVQVKILKDLSLASMLLAGGLLAVALPASGLGGGLEIRALHPILARPVRRRDVLLGRYFGNLLTIYIGLAIMFVVFSGLVFKYQHRLDWLLLIGMAYIWLEVALLAGISTLLSTIFSPALAVTLALMCYICGSIKLSYLGHVLAQSNAVIPHSALWIVYHALPNLESFNFKEALVHGVAVPGAYLWWVAAYGLVYTAAMIWLANLSFQRLDL